MTTWIQSEAARVRLDIENAQRNLTDARLRLQAALNEQAVNDSAPVRLRISSSRNAIATLERTLSGLQLELTGLERALAQEAAGPPAQPNPSTVQQQLQADTFNSPTQQPQQTLDEFGTVVDRPAVTTPTNATPAVTLDNGGEEFGTDPPVRTLQQTQAVRTTFDEFGNEVPVLPDDNLAFEAPQVFDDNLAFETPQVFDDNLAFSDLPDDDLAFRQAAPRTSINVSAGIGANDDDPQTSGVTNTRIADSGVQQEITADKLIEPQPNVLDQFASYTYQASVYIMSDEQFNQFTQSRSASINGYYLLFQSGGAPKNEFGAQGPAISTSAEVADVGESPDTTVSGLQGGVFQDGRNPFFTEDFYIDQITINNVIGAGGEAGSPISTATLDFTVIEPANITLIDRLYQAAQDVAPKSASGAVNYSALNYLMVIRFYGYDANGKLVAGIKAADPATKLSDPNSIVEKYIPFRINELNWSVSGKLVTYEFKGTSSHNAIGTGVRRGTVPFDIELSGGSVKDVLAGSVGYSTASAPTPTPGAATTAPDRSVDEAEARRFSNYAPAASGAAAATPPPPKASAAPSPSNRKIKQGLMSALNEIQDQLVAKGIYTYPDRYVIEFGTEAKPIQDALIVKPRNLKTNKALTPMSPAASQNTKSASPDSQNMDVTQRNLSIKAGSQLVQVLDLVIRNSTYITNQALVVIDETTGQPVPNPRSNTTGMNWYRFLLQTKQLQYDPKRNDFAYEVKIIVVPYVISEMWSPYFPTGTFPGIHKSYPYWFTGLNTAVLDYQATFNKNYFLTVSGSEPGENDAIKAKRQAFQSMRDIPFLNYFARSKESDQGSDSKANELSASAAEFLYTGSDNANSRMTIVGDPAWIQQGVVRGGIDSKTFDRRPFNNDGTINFDYSEVLYEIAWQRPEDYDLVDGLADPYRRTQAIFKDRQPRQSIIYRAKSVTSEFRQGTFRQILEGTQYTLVLPDLSNKATTAPATKEKQPDAVRPAVNQTDAETARLNRQARSGTVNSQSTQDGSIDAAEAARLRNYNNTGPRAEPAPPPPSSGSSNPGTFSAPTPQPADTAVPTPPPSPPTSNGEPAGTTVTPTPPPSLGSSVQGTLQLGRATGPIVVDGRNILPGEPGYAEAEARLIESSERLNRRSREAQGLNTNNSAPGSAPIGVRDF